MKTKFFLWMMLLLVSFAYPSIVEPVISHPVTSHPVSVHVSKPVSHISTAHVSEPTTIHPVSTVHETPMYSPVKSYSPNEIHTYPSGICYYLILNNHTHKYDTIKAANKQQLKSKLDNITQSKEESVGFPVWSFVSVVVVGLMIIISFGENE